MTNNDYQYIEMRIQTIEANNFKSLVEFKLDLVKFAIA